MKQTSGRTEAGTKSTVNKTSRKANNKSRHKSSRVNATSNKGTESSGNASGPSRSSGKTHTSSGVSRTNTCVSKIIHVNNNSNNTLKVGNDDCAITTQIYHHLSFPLDPAATRTFGEPAATIIKIEPDEVGSQSQIGNKRESIAIIPRISLDGNITKRKYYCGLSPRSIRTIWEQHDQSDLRLSTEVCTRIAQDVSYKLWELVSNIKTYARHSGDMVTYDLVNEVLKDADVPPCLGALDNDWERIDYDGAYYFYSDKILELRDEYQREISFDLPTEKDFRCSWPINDKHLQQLKEYVPNLLFVILNGEEDDVDAALMEASSSSLIGCCYRLILYKIIEILALRQIADINQRCWRLLRALARNPQSRDVDCRMEYFHLSEVLVCQLLAPFESIKTSTSAPNGNVINMPKDYQTNKESNNNIPLETIKLEPQNINEMTGDQQQDQQPAATACDSDVEWINEYVEKTYKLLTEDSEDQDEETDEMEANKYYISMDRCNKKRTMETSSEAAEVSGYFASPVDEDLLDELCDTLGQLAFINGYFQNECIHHINKRLNRLFESRQITTERDYKYISRSIRGLIALGGYAFSTFIPFIYDLNPLEIPEFVWPHFSMACVFLRNDEDKYLYEWLAFVCGADKLQPFLTYYANYFEKFLYYSYMRRKQATFSITPKVTVRRLEWSTLVAAMCHGDDPTKALKPKPTIEEVFPDRKVPNNRRSGPCELNRGIRFRFSGCRPLSSRTSEQLSLFNDSEPAGTSSSIKEDTPMKDSHMSNHSSSDFQLPAQQQQQHDIIIARRKLLKPLSNEKRMRNSSNYYCIRI